MNCFRLVHPFKFCERRQNATGKRPRNTWTLSAAMLAFASMLAHHLPSADSESSCQGPVQHTLSYNTHVSNALAWLPSRSLSRVMGWVMDIELPEALRGPLLRLYMRATGVVKEDMVAPVESYVSVRDLFEREVKPRTLAAATMVCPCDARVVAMGAVDNSAPGGGHIRQVKGISYSVEDFLGMIPDVKDGNTLWFATLYLSPGDYHRFHAPCAMQVRSHAHFAGQLLPVNWLGVNLVPGLFAVNERVACLGSWLGGFMAYTAVGAFGVGSMRLAWDGLATNQSHQAPGMHFKDYATAVELPCGGEMGRFSFGSTVVLVFEAPADAQWAVQEGEAVRMGQEMLR